MRRFTVSAPIVAIASVEVMAEDAEEAREIGYEVLLDGSTNSSIHVWHDFDIEHEEVTAELTEEDPARTVASHVAREHFDIPEEKVNVNLTANYEQWRAMHAGLHDTTPCTHTHEEMP